MSARHLRQAGFTLVELMISMALGLLIILALLTMLVNINRNNVELSGANRMVESGRVAVRLLSSDLSVAGYWGGHLPDHDSLLFSGVPVPGTTPGGSVPTGVPDPCVAYGPANWNGEYQANLIGIPVHAAEVTSPPAAPFCPGVVTNPRADSDVLVVRRAETCVAGSGPSECSDTSTSGAPDVYFQASFCNTDASPYLLGTGGFTLRQRDCTALSPLRRFVSSIYFVQDDAAGVPTLMRSAFAANGGTPQHQPAEALVEGVQAFRVEFGVDSVSDSGGAVNATDAIVWADPAVRDSPTNRGDGIPDGAYVHCTEAVPCSAYQLMNSVAARIYVLVRAERPTPGYQDTKTYTMGSSTAGPFNDGYKRHVFTQTVRMINVSGRRETP